VHRVLGGIAFLWGLFPGFAVASEGGGFINLDRSLLIQAVNFLLLLLLLWRFVYRPFLGKLDERAQTIKKALADAEAARAEAERRREEQQAKIQAAYQEAQSIREAALKEAAEEQRRLIEGARAEAARMVEAARGQIEQDVRRAREDLQREVADLAVAVAERLIRKSLRDPDHLRIVDEAIEGLERRR
jgi:F-type H+-transporting ATPase subunit b